MAYKPLGGTSRRYVDTETGETISRRQYEKRLREARITEIESRLRERFAEVIPVEDFEEKHYEAHGWNWTEIDISDPERYERAFEQANRILQRAPSDHRVLIRAFGYWTTDSGGSDPNRNTAGKWITLREAFDSSVYRDYSLSVPGQAEVIMIGVQKRK